MLLRDEAKTIISMMIRMSNSIDPFTQHRGV